MAASALNAYTKSRRLGLNGRALEAEAFLQAARMLDTIDISDAIKGLKFTHSLWTIVQADLLDPANKLSDGLKNDMLSLSLFVDQEIARALTRPSRDRLQTLSSINRNLAAGLLALN